MAPGYPCEAASFDLQTKAAESPAPRAAGAFGKHGPLLQGVTQLMPLEGKKKHKKVPKQSGS